MDNNNNTNTIIFNASVGSILVNTSTNKLYGVLVTLLPNNKIIFGFSRLCGSDTADEVLFLVNNDGSYQQTLFDGFVGIEFLWQVVNGSLITWTEDGNLLEYFGAQNKMKMLIEGKISEIEFINFK